MGISSKVFENTFGAVKCQPVSAYVSVSVRGCTGRYASESMTMSVLRIGHCTIYKLTYENVSSILAR